MIVVLGVNGAGAPGGGGVAGATLAEGPLPSGFALFGGLFGCCEPPLPVADRLSPNVNWPTLPGPLGPLGPGFVFVGLLGGTKPNAATTPFVFFIRVTAMPSLVCR